MPIRVQVGSKIVEFPDGTTEDVMRGALSKLSHPLDVGDTVRARQEMNTQEGDGGVIKGMVSMGSGMAHPQSLSDVASLLIPSDLGFGGGAKLLGEGVSRGYQAVKAASAEGQGIRGALTLPVRTFNKFRDALPSNNAAAVEKFMGPESTVVKKAPSYVTGADIIDRNLASMKPKPPVVPKPPMAKVQTLEDAMQAALEEALSAPKEAPPLRSTMAPPVETAGGGAYKQSWTKTKKQNLGGYDSGNPSTSRETVDEIYDRATSPGGRFGTAEAEPVPLRTEEAPVTVTPDAAEAPQKLKLSADQVAESLRRYYGSRDGGRMLFPNNPSAGADALKRMAPGPSRMPLTAEARINNVPQPQSLEDALRDIILKRGEQ
jgi:hypothetical protein